jgi:uncharacterized protein YkwD
MRTRGLQGSFKIRWLARVIVACMLMGSTISIAAPLAAAHANGHHRRHARHHRRHRHHRHHGRHHRRHHGPREPGAKSAQDKYSFCPYADVSATSGTLAQMDQAVDCLINQQRVRFGLPALNISSKLDTSAQNWNDHMVGTGQFTHGSDKAFSNRLLAVDYNWGTGGENIATGYLTPRDAVAAWMASPDHCQNVLDPDFADVGTGETAAPVGNYASTPATWTQDFGTPMGQNSPSQKYGPMNGCPYTIPSSHDPSSSGSGSGSGSGQGGTPSTPPTTPPPTTPPPTGTGTTGNTGPTGTTGTTGPTGETGPSGVYATTPPS